MDPNELLNLLDLNDTRAGPTTEPALTVSSPEDLAQTIGSPTALEVDEWGLRRGRDLMSDCERIRCLDLNEHAVADCHVAAFDPTPRLTTACHDQWRRKFFAALLESPEYRALHLSTRLDPVASEIAATHFAEELARHRKEDGQDGEADQIVDEVAALRSVYRAVSAAREEVRECRDAATALGLGPGFPRANDAKAIAELFRRVRNDAALKKICSLAGRYRRLAQSKQRRKTCHGLDDVVGVDMGGDLGRILPHELARLAVPEFEADTLRRLVERQIMSREHHATEPVGKGPIIVCVDESGSMEGNPVHSAKAIAVALAWVARQQRRWCALVAYSGDSGERLLALPPARWNEIALANWLIEFIGAGSILDVPVREMPRIYRELKAPIGATDVIFVTDCQCSIPDEVQETFNAWKKSVQARLLTLVIGDDAGDLALVSDEIHLVRTLSVGETGVGRALSL